MNEATLAQTIMTGLILIIFLGFLIWGIASGQFRNVEEPKYRMLQDDLKSEEEDNESKSRKQRGKKR